MSARRTPTPRSVLVALALLPACGAFDACMDARRAPIVYVDIVDRVSGADGVELPRARLEAGVTKVMRAWPDFGFRQKTAEETGWQLDLVVGLATERVADPEPGQAPDADRVHRAVRVQLRLHALGKVELDPSEIRADAMVTRDESRATPFGDVAELAVVEAGARMQAAMDLYWGDPGAVVPALSDEDEWRRGIAVDAAGLRKLAGARDKLMAMVRDEQEAPLVRIRAVGSLVAIGDPAAAAAIIDACRRKDAPYLVQMVFALGQLGGRDAEGYLFTVQSGYPDPKVREAAKQALEELEARRAKDGAP